MMGPVEKPKNFRFTLKRVWHYFKREQHLLLLVFIFIILGSGLGLLVPFLLGKVADLLLLDPVDFAKLKVFIGILLGTYLLDVLTSFIQEWIMAGISERVVFGLRGAIFKKLQKLPISFFDKYTHGEIMSRLSNDVENVSMTISQSAIQLMSGVINILGALFMMLYLSPLLTGASMITIPLVIIMTRSIAKKTRKFFKQQQISLGALNGHIEESISGIQVVQAFNHEEQVIAQFNQINANLCDVGIKAQILSGFIMPLMNVINNLGFAVVALVGGVLAIQGQITVGVIVSFLSYSRQFSRPLNEIANTFNTLQSGVAGAERVFEVLDEQEESEDVEEAEVLEDVKGEVVFKNVTFGYDPKEPVLNNVSFHVKQGSNIALVGPTGAGKTTVVNLLTRFYEINEGEIQIDGRDIRLYSRDSLRRCFGMVLQDTYLFSGTVKENIQYGRLDATEEEIKEAARSAKADSFIQRLPKGYHTQLVEGGINLSQGERQLLAIARAILADPSILILDEATSNVDTRTELHIQEAMLVLMKNRTTFIIAHRLSTIQHADVIMVVDDGKIVESGNHQTLIEKKGVYYKLYHSQFMNTNQ
ncbi:MAG: ABC transporter ATP-binding protein [Epulopiscium sp.]|nr:ABC transporter ATP-binding protein [Candidatus Epulonipiscium sp.]